MRTLTSRTTPTTSTAASALPNTPARAARYGSSEATAEFVAEIRSLFDKNDVLWQIGEMGKVDLGGGGTVALYIAGMNVDVIDIGVPVLSMHSPFEVVSKLDIYMTYKGILSFYEA